MYQESVRETLNLSIQFLSAGKLIYSFFSLFFYCEDMLETPAVGRDLISQSQLEKKEP